MAFGQITQSHERELAVDFSYPYDNTATGIVSKKSGHVTNMLALFLPFQLPVWLAITVAFVSFVPAYWVSSYNTQENTKISFATALIQSIQCLLLQSNKNFVYVPPSCSKRQLRWGIRKT